MVLKVHVKPLPVGIETASSAFIQIDRFLYVIHYNPNAVV